MGLRQPSDVTELFGRHISIVAHRDFHQLVAEIAQRDRQRVLFCNVHMLMLSREDSQLATAMDQADWVLADGVPVAWLQRRISAKQAQVIRGYELMLELCRFARDQQQRIGLLGSTPDVLRQLADKLQQRFPGLQIACQHAPEFSTGVPQTDAEALEEINHAAVQWLFVGMGCPKQEKWIHQYGDSLDCHLLGVGAAFDWLAGSTAKPPGWMEKAGLAWLFRLLQNPRKMWYRYLNFNSKFLYNSAKLLMRQRGARSHLDDSSQ
jgi:N-acetylglucosaminyldiphosphoundecaprenol N-acetyl-beta-D-mannosaminyltransferase